MYPKNFFFAITKEGIDGRRSLLVEEGHRRRRSSTATQSKEARRYANRSDVAESEKAETPKKQLSQSPPDSTKKPENAGSSTDADMADLTGAMSALNFVPPSVRFGRGRAGFTKR
jgi:hypothetical protein